MSGDFWVAIVVPYIMEISSYFYHLLVAVFIEVLIMDVASSPEASPDLLQTESSPICEECAAFDVSSMISDSFRSRWYKLAFLKGWKLSWSNVCESSSSESSYGSLFVL